MWIVLSLLCAFFEALKDVFGKKALTRSDPMRAAFYLRLWALPFLIPWVAYEGVPELTTGFWVALAAVVLLLIPSQWMYFRAVQVADLSHAVPMIAFTPLFLTFTSPVMVGEFPDWRGLIGIILGVLGAYVMNLTSGQKSALDPVKAVFREKGPRLMLGVAFIWSLCANFDKIAVEGSSPAFWSFALNAGAAVSLIPFIIWGPKRRGVGRAPIGTLSLMGFFGALAFLAQMNALQYTLVAYVISVKRLSAVFVVLFGVLFFGEKNFRQRFLGALLMLSGVFFVGWGD